MKRISALFIVAIVLLIPLAQANAYDKKEVLGETTSPSEVVFPAVTSGPGFILPDSPFYFLDELKQSIKLTLAMGPRTRALIHAQIAGERLAELRIMMERENAYGIQKALNGISYEMAMAVHDMNEASAQGKDVKKLSADLNELLKVQQDTLSQVSTQTTGSLALAVRTTEASLQESKTDVEELLPAADQENELTDAIIKNMDTAVLGVTTARIRLETATDALQKQSSAAAARTVEEKQKELDEAKKTGDNNKIKAAQDALALAEKEQEKLLEAQSEALKSATEAIMQAAESAREYQNAKNIFLKLKSGETESEPSI